MKIAQSGHALLMTFTHAFCCYYENVSFNRLRKWDRLEFNDPLVFQMTSSEQN